MNLDQWIVFYMNQIGGLHPFIDPTVVFFAEYLPYLVALTFVYLAWRFRTTLRERGIFFFEGALAVFLARAVFVEFIRFFIHRPRPYLDNHAIVALLSETSYSFPSGHAAFFFALATTVYFKNKSLGIFFYIASTVIGLARIAAGVHYLTDILGGALLGVVVGVLVQRYFKRFRTSIFAGT